MTLVLRLWMLRTRRSGRTERWSIGLELCRALAISLHEARHVIAEVAHIHAPVPLLLLQSLALVSTIHRLAKRECHALLFARRLVVRAQHPVDFGLRLAAV